MDVVELHDAQRFRLVRPRGDDTHPGAVPVWVRVGQVEQQIHPVAVGEQVRQRRANAPRQREVQFHGVLATGDMLPTEQIPRWAAFWLADGHDGAAPIELAGLHGDDPREVRDLLPAALADCGVAVPTADSAAAMVAFTNFARLCIDGRAGERWIVDKVSEILTRSGYPNNIVALPLGQLYGLDDEWGAGWGRADAELRTITRQACLDRLRLAATH